jgi:NADH:ubiquinone oxidoreductase subunit E
MVALSTPGLEENLIDFTSFSREPHQLIPILQYCQSHLGYISREMVRQIADYLDISEARVYGVASFYTQFRFEKPGDHQIRICLGTACHVQSGELLSEIQKSLDTRRSPDNKLRFRSGPGLLCAAPVVEVDGRIYGKMTRKKLQKVLANYESI